MNNDLNKYLHKNMDKAAGIEHAFKRTKIVATVGPACSSYEKLLELVKSGVNVFRLNFSHVDYAENERIINDIKKINKEEPYNIAILGDLQGPKLRVGELESKDGFDIVAGDKMIFTTEKMVGNKQKVYVSYPMLCRDVKVGEKILLDDGKLEVEVASILNETEIEVKVNLGGRLLQKKGVNLPDTSLSMPAITEKDLIDLDFIVAHNLDWIALSFVRKAEDITALKKLLKDKGSKLKVIAKIEMPEALRNLRDIINESDAIMVARGDLGVELPFEDVPMAQKEIIRKSMRRAKPVIVATQMLESMMERTKPNRSEVTDIANAVLEGADAVMLSGETAMGNYPVLAVQTMSKIIKKVEATVYDFNRDDILKPQVHSPSFLSDAVCYNAAKIADDVQADALIGMTQSGYTGFMLSSYRPKSALYVFTKEKTLVNQLSLSWGVRAFYYTEENSLDEQINDQINILKERGFIKNNDVIVNTGSTPIADHLPTNLIKVTKVS
jgi:pyruvate kinase